jgi:hypothetical protein
MALCPVVPLARAPCSVVSHALARARALCSVVPYGLVFLTTRARARARAKASNELCKISLLSSLYFLFSLLHCFKKISSCGVDFRPNRALR